MATENEINSSIWAMSINGFGLIAQGADLIKQRILLVLTTSKGTSPLRPFFGSDIFKYVDAPINIGIPNIIQCINDALNNWVPEVKVSQIVHDLEIATQILKFTVYYTLVDDSTDYAVTFGIVGGTISSDLQSTILVGKIPDFYLRLSVSLVMNGQPVYPLTPLGGFANVQDLFDWVLVNWGSYGRWIKGSNAIYLYANPSMFKTGSITVSPLFVNKFIATVPNSNGNQIVAKLLSLTETKVSDGFDTIAELLTWLKANWAEYGEWGIEAGEKYYGDFNDDFNSDYNAGTFYSINLVLITSNLSFTGIAITYLV